MNLRLVNLDRVLSAALGGLPSDQDFCHVYDDDQKEPHPLTGEPKSKLVKFGTLKECGAFIQQKAVKP